MTPPPPGSLDETGKAEWTCVVGLLLERGQWDPLRSTVLLAYCESYGDWHRLTEQVRGKEVVLAARGVVHVDEQCARRAAVLKPRMFAAIDLDELAQTRPPGPGLMRPTLPLGVGDPQPRRAVPAKGVAQSFDVT